MIGIKYFKADSTTFVIKSRGGQVRDKGKGLSFFFNAANTSIASIPISVQEAPFIFNLQTSDYQDVAVQGQIIFRITDPEKIAEMLNFTVGPDARTYVSDDPEKLGDRVIRAVQTLIQNQVQEMRLRECLSQTRLFVDLVKTGFAAQPVVAELGLSLVDATISAITPQPQTMKALETEAREAILKEADDAVYDRRKSAVDQERLIKDAELDAELAVQQKQQELEQSGLENQRALMQARAATEQEQIRTQIEAENQRKSLVSLNAENDRLRSESDAYALSCQVEALKKLPVEYLKAMALANMGAGELMAMGFESMAQNAEKIGELNIGPDLFGKLVKGADACE